MMLQQQQQQQHYPQQQQQQQYRRPQPQQEANKFLAMNEQCWLTLANLADSVGDRERSAFCHESALRNNPYSVPSLMRVAQLHRQAERYPQAIELLQRLLNIDGTRGDAWQLLAYCYMMTEELAKSYSAYQQALYSLVNPRDCNLWYGIGMLYDKYGSYEHAEEAFQAVLGMDSQFDRAAEIRFRLGLIYKQQSKWAKSRQYFEHVLTNLPKPLTETDVRFQIALVLVQQKEYVQARDTLNQIVAEKPRFAKVVQQLGWLYVQPSEFRDDKLAEEYLTKAIGLDVSDGQSYYLLGRICMARQDYTKAYEYYQQAVYRDGRNPVFWCSIGVLYYQINQYRDALDAYTRAIRISPYIAQVWCNLGTLYESCNNQVQDAIDAYVRAAELDSTNTAVRDRITYLRQMVSAGQSGKDASDTAIPPPAAVDIDPNTFKYGMGVPTSFGHAAHGGQQPASLGRPPAAVAPIADSTHEQNGKRQAEAVDDTLEIQQLTDKRARVDLSSQQQQQPPPAAAQVKHASNDSAAPVEHQHLMQANGKSIMQ